MKTLQKAIESVNNRFLAGRNDDDQVKRMVEIANKTKGYHFTPRYDTYELCTDLERLIQIIEKYGYWHENTQYFNDILLNKGGHSYMSDLNNQAKEIIRLASLVTN